MKKLASTIFTIFSLIEMSNAQQLVNTTWTTYNTSIMDTVYVTFTIDSIIQIDGSENLLVSSWYAENEDTVWLLDAAGPYQCINPDTGVYKLNIHGDTMNVSLVDDSCALRAIAYDGVELYRVKTATGFATDLRSSNSTQWLTQSGSNVVTLNCDNNGYVEIFNQTGQLILRKTHSPGKSNFQMETGFYIFRMTTPDNEVFVHKTIVN